MKLITHSLTFHTDDVFGTALLLELYPDAEVVRTRDEEIIKTGDIVYDVGKVYDPSLQRFDHHQQDAPKRENGITYCGFGLLWKEYGTKYCDGDSDVARIIEEKLVVPVDANDNGQEILTSKYDGVAPFTIDDIIKSYNPHDWLDESEEPDTQFQEALKLAQQILRRLKKSAQNKIQSQKALLQAYADAEDKRVIFTDKSASASDILEQCPKLLYLISPRQDDTWGVLAVPDAPGSYTSRQAFPEAWRSKSGAELAAASGVSDAIFCHTTGFLAVAKSRDGAAALARNSLGSR